MIIIRVAGRGSTASRQSSLAAEPVIVYGANVCVPALPRGGRLRAWPRGMTMGLFVCHCRWKFAACFRDAGLPGAKNACDPKWTLRMGLAELVVVQGP